ncbi:SulP family inorganic anion transporter [soil metagenome]
MTTSTASTSSVPGFRDVTAGLVVFLVALPLCLGVALASNAPLLSGVLAGIVGGIVVGIISGSQTSVSGPAAGLTAVVAAQIASFGGSFETFLLAVVFAGLLQIGLGLIRAGFLAAFFPSSVIKGLLAAIGVILILKQIPHVLGHDPDPEGDMAFQQTDHQNTFSEFVELIDDIERGAAAIGLLSIVLLMLWGKIKTLKYSPVPAPLVVVLLGVGLSELFRHCGERWTVATTHMVQVPVSDGLTGFFKLLMTPDFSKWNHPAVYTAAVTIAAVATLETLLNLEAVDKLDPQQRTSPPSRELVAQGIGNVVSGLIGGLPVTSVIVRSSVNINAGGKSKLSTIFHGVLLMVSVVLLPTWLNQIPLSCLAAILLVTGFKLASPKLFKQMWKEGLHQFIPFAITVAAIVLTDLLIGVLLGLAVSISFILWNNARTPLRRVMEKHLGGDVVHIELPNQVSFLNKAALDRALIAMPRGGHVLLDARSTTYIDPDILDLIRDYKEVSGPARGVELSLIGFQNKYELSDQIQYMDYSTRELQSVLTPQQILQILKDGHERFRTGQRLTRDFARQIDATAAGQHPLAVVLSCIDSRAPAEILFDMGVGETFVVRIAGNVCSRKVFGSLEYCCAVAGAKVILVMGHTRCGAVTAAVNAACSKKPASPTLCEHLEPILSEIQKSIDPAVSARFDELDPLGQEAQVNIVAMRNVERTVESLLAESRAIRELAAEGRIMILGAMYDVTTGLVTFLDPARPPR